MSWQMSASDEGSERGRDSFSVDLAVPATFRMAAKKSKPQRMSSFGPFREPHSSERFIRRLHSPDFAKDVPETCG